ncbi:hypothetical protein D3C74_467730 [compost metagenome]
MPGEDDALLLAAVEQYRRAVAPVIGFALLLFPAAVGAPVIQRIFVQRIPVVGEKINPLDAHIWIHRSRPPL